MADHHAKRTWAYKRIRHHYVYLHYFGFLGTVTLANIKCDDTIPVFIFSQL